MNKMLCYNYLMDPEKRARRQSLRIIVSESIMVVAVVAVVTVLALIVSGYWINSDFTVERQGMLQVSSVPTGANVEIDGESNIFQRTNTSKVLSSGEHSVVLTKDGYDSWSKTIKVREGLLYRLHYPRLFLLEREKKAVYDAVSATFATVSPNRKRVLIANDTTMWTLLNLDSENLEPRTIDISKIFSAVSLAEGASSGLFSGTILDADWDGASEHVLFKIQNGESLEWVLININTPSASVNLTREFATDFSEVQIFDQSSGTLLAIRNGNLHRIDVSNRQISAILAENVQSYDHLDSNLVYIAGGEAVLTKIGSNNLTKLDDIVVDANAKIFISQFYDDKYITVVTGDRISVYKKDSNSDVVSKSISFIPDFVKIGHAGEFVFMRSGTSIATFDMESLDIHEWTLDSLHFGWLDDDMIYDVKDGALVIYDFDGLNRRELATNVSERFPVTITSDKWLYYFSDGNLIREVIAK